MQFPLEYFYRYVYNTGSINQNRNSRSAASNMIDTLKQGIVQVKLSLFAKMAKASSPKQLRLLLFSLQLSISDLRNTILVQQPPYHKELLDHLRILEDFMQDNFADSGIPWPVKSNPKNTEIKQQVLTTALSVPQIAVFLRLMIDTGILTGISNISQFTAAVARSVSTRRMSPVSAESLRSKYYAPDPHAIDMIRQYLMQMIRLLREYRH